MVIPSARGGRPLLPGRIELLDRPGDLGGDDSNARLDLCAVVAIGDQRRRFLPPIIDGSAAWSIGMSEPDAGSDVAHISTRARREDPDDPASDWKHPAFTQVTRRREKQLLMGYSVRTERWRYTQWGKDGKDGEELYDHANDPREITNLAKDPAQAEVLAGLRKLIEPHREKFLAPDAAWKRSKPQPGR